MGQINAAGGAVQNMALQHNLISGFSNAGLYNLQKNSYRKILKNTSLPTRFYRANGSLSSDKIAILGIVESEHEFGQVRHGVLLSYPNLSFDQETQWKIRVCVLRMTFWRGEAAPKSHFRLSSVMPDAKAIASQYKTQTLRVADVRRQHKKSGLCITSPPSRTA